MGGATNLIIALILCLGSVSAKKLPSFIKYCHRDDPKIDECFRTAVEVIRPRLLNGIPDLLVPSMNPLVLPKASLDNGDSFKATFRNIEVYYANEFQLDGLEVDLKKVHIELRLTFPRLRIKSEYNVNGRILILSLNGTGPADGNFTDVKGHMVIDGSHYDKNGKDHIKFDKKALKLELGKPTFRFDNIFRDNRELNDQTNKVVNENIVDIIDELRPLIDQVVTDFAFGIVERIFDRYSFDELFPK